MPLYEAAPEGQGEVLEIAANEAVIVEVGGRPISFTILGYEGVTVEVVYDGGYPRLFGPNTLVIVDGVRGIGGRIDASSVIIKHENEFVTDPEDTQAFAPASE